MATVVINQADEIEFKNIGQNKPEDAPTLNLQVGAFQVGDHREGGVVVDVFGAEAPLLTSNDARKLSKWLARAADVLDGDSKEKKPKSGRHWQHEQDDDAY